jgi:succinate dehydrogenase / fumarate reductase membrane anchor subunit
MGTGTGIGRVRGLGSARHGARPWWHQRMTAAGNLLLITWFFASLLLLPGYDYQTVVDWLSSPWVATALIVMTLNVFWHLRLGVQVMIEDYVHREGSRFAAIVALNFYCAGAAALAVFSILKIAFGGVQG